MSATTRHIPLHLSGAERAKAASPGVAIAWAINPRALIGAPAAAALLNGHAARLARCSLVWTIDGGRANAGLELTLVSGERDALGLVDRASACWIEDDELGLAHVDVAGMLHASVRATPERVDVLFARTSLLYDRLGLPGGVYDAPEALTALS